MDTLPSLPMASILSSIETQMSEYKAALEKWIQEKETYFKLKQEALQKERQHIVKDKEALAAEKLAFQKEKAAVQKVADTSEVLELNVGGGIFTVKRSTLCMYESMLSAMFSERWSGSEFCRDAAGRVYLELNKECFETVLEWLRSRAIDPPAEIPSPPPGKEGMLRRVIEFLDLEDFISFVGTWEYLGGRKYTVSKDAGKLLFAETLANGICLRGTLDKVDTWVQGQIDKKKTVYCMDSFVYGPVVPTSLCPTTDRVRPANGVRITLPSVIR